MEEQWIGDRIDRGLRATANRKIKITQPNLRMDPFPALVVAAVAATAQTVVDVAAEVVDRTAMAGTEVESAAAVEQTVVSPDSWLDHQAGAGVVEG